MLSKSFAVALCLVGVATVVQAADAPNVVGTWKPTDDFASARSGKARVGFGETPTFHPAKRVSVVIEKQEGRGFTGYRLLPDGSKDACVGVFKHDGKQAILSCNNGKATIDFSGDVTELCFVDDLPDVNVASCDVIRKTP